MDLLGNRIKELADGGFQGLGRLENLSLADNRINRLSRGALIGLNSLKTLNLGQNNLPSFDAGLLAEMKGLKEINLEENCFSLSNVKNIQDRVAEGLPLRLKNKKNVYFSRRAQLLSINTFIVPAQDAAINNVISQVEILGADQSEADYIPPGKSGEAGRLIFKKPGLYRLKMHNRELGMPWM